MLPIDTLAPTKTPARIMPDAVSQQIAREKEAEAARLRLAAEKKQKEADAEKARKLAEFNALTPDKDVNLADPYGNAMPDYDTSGRAALAESLQAAGVKNLSGAPITAKTDMQKVAESMGPTYSNVGDTGPINEDKIPDSQAAIDVKTPVSAATEIATAPPSKIGDVIEKLKEEEKRGGPNFFDILEAAAAGWNGKIPLYVQKELAAKEQEADLKRMQEGAALEETAYQKRKADEEARQKAGFAFDAEQAAADRRNRLELAGLGTPAATGAGGKLSLGGLSAFGGK